MPVAAPLRLEYATLLLLASQPRLLIIDLVGVNNTGTL